MANQTIEKVERVRRMIVLSVPLPPRQLHPNERPFTRKGCIAKAAKAKAYKGRVMIEALAARPAQPIRAAEITLVYYLARRAPRIDRDNLLAWWKHGFDGLVAGGLLVDDDRITHRPPIVEKDAKNPRVEVRIVAIDDDER